MINKAFILCALTTSLSVFAGSHISNSLFSNHQNNLNENDFGFISEESGVVGLENVTDYKNETGAPLEISGNRNKAEIVIMKNDAVVDLAEEDKPMPVLTVCGIPSQGILSDSCHKLKVDFPKNSGSSEFTIDSWLIEIPEAEYSAEGKGSEAKDLAFVFEHISSSVEIQISVTYSNSNGEKNMVKGVWTMKK